MAILTVDESRPATHPFVLVHGAWAGGWVWTRVAPLLRAQGHDVFTPTLTGLGERVHLARPDVDLDTHIQDVVNLLAYEDLDNAVLVGWSYGGMVAAGVLDRVPERLAHVVYLDADVPRDGESDFDVTGPEFREEMEQRAQSDGDGWKASIGDAETIEAFFRLCQPIRLSHRNPTADAVSRTFIRCPIDGAIWAGIYDPIAARLLVDPLYRVHELASNHLAPLVAPAAVTDALVAIAHQLPITAGRTAT